MPLTQSEIEARLKDLPGWSLEDNQITRTYVLKDFVHAMVFVNDVAAGAEALNHHPDIDIRYNKVRLAITTHSAGGLTDKDFTLASRIDHLAAR